MDNKSEPVSFIVIEKGINNTYGFRKLKEFGFHVILLTSNKYLNKVHDDEQKYIDLVIVADTSKDHIVEQTAMTLDGNYNIKGVTSFFEYFVPLATKVANLLKLPANRYEVALNSRNKFRMREALSKANVGIPAYACVTGEEDIATALRIIGFPNIIKPLDLAGSRNVFLNRNRQELLNNFRIIQSQPPLYGLEPSRSALIESFVQGPEYSVESITQNGITTVVAVTEKRTSGDLTFVETQHIVPAPLQSNMLAKISAVTSACISALGITTGVCHTELKIDEQGEIIIIENGLRPAGDSIPYLVYLVTGIDLWAAYIELATGTLKKIKPLLINKFAGIRFITSSNERDIKVVDIESVKSINGVIKVHLDKTSGNELKILTDNTCRQGYMIASSDDYHSLLQIFDEADYRISPMKSVMMHSGRQGNINQYYVSERNESENKESIYTLWEKGLAYKDSVTPSMCSSEYRNLLTGILKKNSNKGKLPIFSVGCGNGFVEAVLIAEGYSVSAIDINPEAVEYARNKGIDASVSDVYDYVSKSNKLHDVVYADGFIGHFFDDDSESIKILEQLNNLLSVDGVIIISNDAPPSNTLFAKHPSVPEFYYYSADFISRQLAVHGFSVLEQINFSYQRPLSGQRTRAIVVGRKTSGR